MDFRLPSVCSCVYFCNYWCLHLSKHIGGQISCAWVGGTRKKLGTICYKSRMIQLSTSCYQILKVLHDSSIQVPLRSRVLVILNSIFAQFCGSVQWCSDILTLFSQSTSPATKWIIIFGGCAVCLHCIFWMYQILVFFSSFGLRISFFFFFGLNRKESFHLGEQLPGVQAQRFHFKILRLREN